RLHTRSPHGASETGAEHVVAAGLRPELRARTEPAAWPGHQYRLRGDGNGRGRRTGSPVRGLPLAVYRIAHRWRRLPDVLGLANRDGRSDGRRFGAWAAVRVLESCGFPMGQSEGVDHGHRGHHCLLARWWRHAGGRGALAAVRARQRTQRDGLGHVRYNPTPLADRPETPSGIQYIHGDNAGAFAVPTSV